MFQALLLASMASEMISLTPRNPRRIRLLKICLQCSSASESATDMPSTRRWPAAVTPTATRAALSTICPASRIRYGRKYFIDNFYLPDRVAELVVLFNKITNR
jgi:hypothetical protein